MIKRLLLFGALALALGGAAHAQGPSWNSPGVSTGINYPQGAQPLAISAQGTTGAVAAALAASTTRLTWICGFVITSGGTSSAIVGDATVSGILGGTLHFAYVAVSSGQGILGVAFPQCLPSSAINTAIVVTAPAAGAGTTAEDVVAWGYQF